VQLFGTMGPPGYFNAKNGVRESTGAIYCLKKESNQTVQPHYHVGHYDALANPPLIRLAEQYHNGALLPCLEWLNLPEN
jgi:hypothetical protein